MIIFKQKKNKTLISLTRGAKEINVFPIEVIGSHYDSLNKGISPLEQRDGEPQ